VIFDVVAWSSTTPALNPVVPPASVPSSFTPPKSGSVQVHNTMTPAEIRRYWTPERMAAARPVTPMEQDTYSGRQKAVAQNNAEYGPNEQDLARFTFGYLEPQFSRITGHLFAIDNSGGGALCSASVVARNLLMTAAHCVKDFVDWFFVPGERGDIVHDPDAAPYGFWPSSGAVYEAAFDTIGPPGDVAVIEIPQDPDTQQYIGDVTGFIPPAADSPGGPKFQIGYPIEGWFGDSCGDPNAPPCSPRPCSDTADTDSCFQYYCWSPTGDYTYVAQDPNVSHGYWIEQAIGCPIAGGGSGGPYYEFINGAWALVSVFSHLSYYVLGYDYPPGACPNPRGPNGAQFCVYLNINSWGSYINGKIIADIYTPNVVP